MTSRCSIRWTAATAATAATLLLSACGDPGAGTPVGVHGEALGEPTEDRPTYVERLALYACNRSRVDPAAINWADFKAVPPLLWHDDLARAARAHSTDMQQTPCFQHESCDGTPFDVRLKMFWTKPFVTMGENIMNGVDDGQVAIHNWIEEIGAPVGETGHRENMFHDGFTHVGFGYVPGIGQQVPGYWTQDFVGVAAATIPPLASGSHFPDTVDAYGALTFGTVYYSKSGVAPDAVAVVIDGTPTPLARINGTDAAGAWEGMATIDSGCHRYYFRASAGGETYRYPDRGTLGVASSEIPDCAEYQSGFGDQGPDGGPAGDDGGAPTNPGSGAGACSAGGARPAGGWAWLMVVVLVAGLGRRHKRTEG